MVTDHGMTASDAEVVVAAGAILHDTGMSIHRVDHEAFSLFLAERKLRELLDGIYEEPELTVVVSEALHCIIGHRRRGQPYTLEAGVVRVADALDMAQGRSRIPVERGEVGIHAISAAAIDDVNIEKGIDRPIRVEIKMNNSAGIFQVDDLLATKIRGTPLEGHIEVIASVEGRRRSASSGSSGSRRRERRARGPVASRPGGRIGSCVPRSGRSRPRQIARRLSGRRRGPLRPRTSPRL